MKKNLNALFYTGLLIVFMPFVIVLMFIYTGSIEERERSSVKIEKPPKVERKIIYDTVRIEVKVPVKSKTKKKSSEDKKVELEQPSDSPVEPQSKKDSI
jgi:hypothetical protein